uniref:Sugar phosphate transporter domain-containing protein n=1 Tax=Globodera rostochiensis TaxID=31243 RepID=A0A914HDM4_GLORO
MALDEEHTERLISILIALLMVTTGSLNTLAAKWADSIVVDGVLFDHPYFQAFCMFIGEFSCLVVFFIIYFVKKRRWRNRNQFGDGGAIIEIGADEEPTIPNFNPFVFLPPACCDVLGTSTMYVGLNLTTASSFQMLRGAVIIFTGLLSVSFLRAQLRGFKWLGMGLVMLGLVIVGASDIMFDDNPKDDLNGIITGDLLIVMAQIIVAIQMVLEQKYLMQYDVSPLLAVGLEGLFGMIVLGTMMLPMYYIRVPSTFSKDPEHRLEDIFHAFAQIHQRPLILAPLALTIISITFFNFAGVTVTKRFSATTRMVLDSVRTLVIWTFSIPLFGEKFIPLQLLGFALLIIGMFVYNDLYFGPLFRREVLPRMGPDQPYTLCCASFCGLDLQQQLDNDDDGGGSGIGAQQYHRFGAGGGGQNQQQQHDEDGAEQE